MSQLRRPEPEPTLGSRARDAIERSWGSVRDMATGDNRVLALMAVSALAGIVVVVGGAWIWQTWSARSTVPVEERLPRAQAGSEAPIEFDPAAPETSSAIQTDGVAQTTSPDDGDRFIPPPSLDGSATPSATPTQKPPIVVHVAGQVVRAGVVQIAADGRVHDAIAAAGGITADADVHRLNLAQPLIDGQRVYVPEHGEEEAQINLIEPLTPTRTSDEVPASTGSSLGRANPTETMPVDINIASAVELETLPGVGPATAAAIIDHRTRRGPFFTVDELLEVSGIGPAKLAAIEGLVTASGNR